MVGLPVVGMTTIPRRSKDTLSSGDFFEVVLATVFRVGDVSE